MIDIFRGATIAVDLDGTLCEECMDWTNLHNAKPLEENIMKIRHQYLRGCKIIIHTSRPWADKAMTERWLEANQVPYHFLVMGKGVADFYIDQRAVRMEEI